MRRIQIGILAALFAALGAVAVAQLDFTITNGSMAESVGTITGWTAFNGTLSHQSIDSPMDPNPGSGSALFTFTSVLGSYYQDTGLLASGQTLRGYTMDVAQDGTFTHLVVAFFEANTYDNFPGSGVDVISDLNIPADTDGTLDTFTTVEVPAFTLPSTNNPVFLYIGTSNTLAGWTGAVANTSTMAIDNVHLAPPSEVGDWVLFQ